MDAPLPSRPPLPEFVVPLDDAALTKETIESLRRIKSFGTVPSTKRFEELGLDFSILPVKNHSSSELVSVIEDFLRHIERNVIGTPMKVPSSVVYENDFDRRIALLKKRKERSLTFGKGGIIISLIREIYAICKQNIYVSLQELCYRNFPLYKDQIEIDEYLHDIAYLLGCTRSSIRIFGEEKGSVAGRLIYCDDTRVVDWTNIPIVGSPIPLDMERVGDVMRSDAYFILLVENRSIFIRLVEDKFYNKFPCIIVTCSGQPDVGTRIFLKKLSSILQLPVLALMDADVYGIQILSTYLFGSQKIAYDKENLNIRWLGLLPSDMELHVPKRARIKLEEEDIEEIKVMDKKDEFSGVERSGWKKEFAVMLKTGETAELEALTANGYRYLSDVYLPSKLRSLAFL